MENKGKRARHASVTSSPNDLISEFPLELLGIIVSGLNMKEAARTSVLSHRWRSVWKQRRSLHFEDKDKMRLIFYGKRSVEDEAEQYRDWVNNAIIGFGHEGPTLEQLKIVFPSDFRYIGDITTSYIVDITRWLYFAVLKRVRKLEVDLTSMGGRGCYGCSEHSSYNFPSFLLESSNFNRLTSLTLKSVSISEADLTYFLSTCSLLEQLLVEDASSLQNVRVSGQSLKLQHLDIRYCIKLQNVEVSDTNLASFTYAGPKINMTFANVPKLSFITLISQCCEMLLLNSHTHIYFSQLKKLELDLIRQNRKRVMEFPRKFPEFTKLEQLELKFMATEKGCLLFLTPIIAASPRLQKLKLQYTMYPTLENYQYLFEDIFPPEDPHGYRADELEKWWENLPADTYQSLRVIEFVGWFGLKSDAQLANYLIESASAGSLEKIIFDLRIPHPFRDASWAGEFHPEARRDREAALRTAMEMERKLPPGAQLIIV